MPPTWKLDPAIGAQTQGLVVSGFSDLPFGRALLLRLEPGTTGGAWLQALHALAPITHAAREEASTRAAAIAFTGTGLRRMGLGPQALASFSRPFREGMFQEDRLRRLGDRRKREWQETVLRPDGPAWSANTPQDRFHEVGWVGAYDVLDPDSKPEQVTTPLTVHALVLLYTLTEDGAETWSDAVKQMLPGIGVAVVRELDLLLDVDKQTRISREHFGFADGLSQPVPYGLDVPIDESGLVLLAGAPAPRHEVQGVPLGEILLGYQNGHSEPAPGPVVAQDARAAAAQLAAHPQAEGFADLGINGSYLVARELKQDVAAFWTSLAENARRIRAADPSASHVTELWLAERIIGRGVDGHLLCPGPTSYLKADQYSLPDNDYRFHERDPHGLGCPVGSHVRRANPRDALAPEPTQASRDALLQAANNHRILRRGRKYGPKAENHTVADAEDRGLLFMCLNTDIERQFEFVQQTWLLNSTFATLFNETDPLLGPKGKMTIREEPVRRTVQVDSFVQMAGGDYFFLPSLPAIEYLSRL